MYANTSLTPSDALLLLQGLGMTLFIFIVTFAIGSVAGLGLGLVRQARVPVASQLALVYVELFRNSPLLVQLFLVYFGLPISFGLRLSPLTAGLITLSVNTAAFMAVIVQSAVDEVPRGQWESARAFGLGYRRSMIHVILPQAVQAMLPPAVSLAVSQLQVSSLVSVIGVLELTRVGANLNLRTLQPFLVWPIVGLGYFIVSKPLSMLADRAEARLRGRGRTARVALAQGPA
jgi:glutamine transport system permease protein